MGKMRRQFTLTPATRPVAPDSVTWPHSEMLKTRVAHGYCSREPAAEACPYANICENRDSYVPSAEFVPVLRAQLADVEVLRDDATERGRNSETAWHTRVAESLTKHLRAIDPQPPP